MTVTIAKQEWFQIAYLVDDLDAAIERWTGLFGGRAVRSHRPPPNDRWPEPIREAGSFEEFADRWLVDVLEALEPTTLAVMHGASCSGNGGQALRDLAAAYHDMIAAA